MVDSKVPELNQLEKQLVVDGMRNLDMLNAEVMRTRATIQNYVAIALNRQDCKDEEWVLDPRTMRFTKRQAPDALKKVLQEAQVAKGG